MIRPVLLGCLLLAMSCRAAPAAVPGNSVPGQSAPAGIVQLLAPDGTLHAAINYGNPVLAQRLPAQDAPHGVSAELARALGQALGVPVGFAFFDEAGQVSAALHGHADAWDVAFLAIDPVRASDIAFTPPYVEIAGAYLVPATSPWLDVGEVDRPGTRIAVAAGSAYDLFLTRALKQAQLVRLPNGDAAADAFLDRHLEALAGVRPPLAAFAAGHPGVRLLPGRFMAIEQAMAVPKDRAAALPFLRDFIERMKADGFVEGALAASGQSGATVAPAAP